MYMNSNVRLHSQEKCNCRSRGGSFTRIRPIPAIFSVGQESTASTCRKKGQKSKEMLENMGEKRKKGREL
jgi:uracil-DNA glycosylase